MAKHNDTGPEGRSVRLLRVGEQFRHILSELLARGEVHDDVLNSHSVSVTEVRMSPDLRHATAFIKPLLGVNEAVVLKALRTNTAFFQKEVFASTQHLLKKVMTLQTVKCLLCQKTLLLCRIFRKSVTTFHAHLTSKDMHL
jgi:ribosome-binding factor A